MTPKQALNNLYLASRLAPLPAEQHEILIQSIKVLDAIINPPAKVETPAPKE